MNILCEAWGKRRNIVTLISNDFSQNYVKSYMGFLWAILVPLIQIIVLVAVFQWGFKLPTVGDSGHPFVVWLTCGMVCWYFFSDGLIGGATAVTSYSFLVRKALFRVSFLPFIRISGSFIIHCCLMFFFLCILAYNNIWPSLYWLQWLYYSAALFVLLVGTAFVTSSISIFIPDVCNLLGVIVNVGFWATPIFWKADMISNEWRWVLHVNPVDYCVQGYRDSFLQQRWFWERPLWEHGVFFLWVFGLLFFGIVVFKKLRPFFADEL